MSKKKKICIASAAALLAVIIAAAVVFGIKFFNKDKENFETGFRDGNFESADSFAVYWNKGWAPVGSEHEWNELSHTDDGSGSLRVTHYTHSSTWSQTIHVVENAKYKISAWIKFDGITSTTENGNGGAYIVLDGCTGLVGQCTKKDVPYTADWTYFENYFTAAFTGDADLMCRVWGAKGVAYFDEIKVELVAKVDPDIAMHWAKEKDIDFPEKGSGFTIAAIGDTQIPVASNSSKYLKSMTNLTKLAKKWNLQYVAEVGDIVDSCTKEQWVIASQGHEILDEAGIRYALSMGNHDYGSYKTGSSLIGLSGSDTGDYRLDNKNVLKYDHTGFESTFSLEEYIEKYGSENFGAVEDSMTNTWHKFTYDGEKYMIISLEYAPKKSTVDAAKALCDSNPDTHVIVTTHCFLNPRSLELQDDQSAHLKNIIASSGLWKSLIKTCPNIFLVCSGHFDTHGTASKVVYNDAGNPVTFVCIDPQGTVNGEEVMAAFIHIENGTEVSVYTYCLSNEKFYNGSSYKITVPQGTAGSKGGVLSLEKGYSGKFFEEKQLDGTQNSITFTYTSSDESVVTVAEDGTITCLKEGSAVIRCVIDRHQSIYCLNSKGVPVGAQSAVELTVEVK